MNEILLDIVGSLALEGDKHYIDRQDTMKALVEAGATVNCNHEQCTGSWYTEVMLFHFIFCHSSQQRIIG